LPDGNTRRIDPVEEGTLISPSPFSGSSRHFIVRRTVMELSLSGIVLGSVLPLYPMLFAIYQKIGRYDEIVEEFKKLKSEHENYRMTFHGK
jgi:hypothetical protein